MDSKARKNKTQRLSKDGKWRSFPKVPGLLQYIASGAYSGKLKIQGKQIRPTTKLPGRIATAMAKT